MEINIETKNTGHTIRFSGTFDAASCRYARTILGELEVSDEAHYFCCFEKVDFIDSSGLGVLVGFLKRVRKQNGQVALINLNSSARKLFELTQLDKVFSIQDDIDSDKTEA